MSDEKRGVRWEAAFPVMRDERIDGPRSVPWSLVAPHEAQARRNHGGQTLHRLAERGGLSPRELLAVLTGRLWRDVRDMAPAEVARELDALTPPDTAEEP